MSLDNNFFIMNTSNRTTLFYGPLSSLILSTTNFDIIFDAHEIIDIKLLISTLHFTTSMHTIDGLLITAMKTGKRLLIKNIDPRSKLFNLLKPVIEKRCINGILANKNFELCFTSNDKFNNRNIVFRGGYSYTLREVIQTYKSNNCLKLKVCLVYLFTVILKMAESDIITKSFYVKFILLIESGVESREEFYLLFSLLFIANKENYIKFEISDALKTYLCIKDEIKEHCNNDNEFVTTDTVIQNMLMLNLAVKFNIPVLLIGETGTGKTTIIQEMHKSRCNKLIIMNMSIDTDIQDLIGHMISETNGSSEGTGKITSQKFIFRDGPLTKAIAEGHWVLIDEINLAPKETLNALCAIIEKKEILLLENTQNSIIKFHRDFRIFACMNPGNDFGKKEFRNEMFHEIYFDDFSNNITELTKIAKGIIFTEINIKNEILMKNASFIVSNTEDNVLKLEIFSKVLAMFFIEIKEKIKNNILIGNHLPPIISGRTFVRFLKLIRSHDLDVLIHLFFYTQFAVECHEVVRNIVSKYFRFIKMRKTQLNIKVVEKDYFVLSRTKNIHTLIECAINANLPILLQGPTSTGKTSVIKFFAELYQKKLHRINNHEHIDASDYLGSFFCRGNGMFTFNEGILIKAMRDGDWIILDELNLAPSDVLEILNRLLDDNKEIMVNNKTVKAHKDFRFFATQNLNYGGRKMLSRAFRNRFVELQFEKFNSCDLREILKRKQLPTVFINKMIEIFEQLDHLRSINVLITIRDLFKWANRNIGTLNDLFVQGLSILLERQRNNIDREIVLNIFEKTFKDNRSTYFQSINKENDLIQDDNFMFTSSGCRLYNCIQEALKNKESILLIGETGIGKTTIIDILALHKKTNLITLPMHQHIDSMDFVGSYTIPFAWLDGPLTKAMKNGDFLLIDEINLAQDSVLERLNSIFEKERQLYIVENDKLITAHDNFNIFACMNPGNDYGKRELTPALRNRFTEIYYEINDHERLQIFMRKIIQLIKDDTFSNRFIKLFRDRFMHDDYNFKENFSLRRLNGILDAAVQYRNRITDEVLININDNSAACIFDAIFNENNDDTSGWDLLRNGVIDRNVTILDDSMQISNTSIGVSPFMLRINKLSKNIPIASPTTRKNIKNIIKALIINQSILLQGKPGVGKTSFIKQLATLLNKIAIRMNLSEDTEMTDLCGAFVPLNNEGKSEIKFFESEMVKAFRNGDWVILDEINLASQSVIEGLNSVLDYRRELFYNGSIKLSKNTRIFATMNNSEVSDGRKKLPKSFLDRFVIVDMEEYSQKDVDIIVKNLIEEIYAVPGCKRTTFFDKEYYMHSENSVSLYLHSKCFDREYIQQLVSRFTKNTNSLRQGLLFKSVLVGNEENILYKYENNKFIFASNLFVIESSNRVYEDFCIVHSQRNSLFQSMKCFYENIPFIVCGRMGKSMLADFIANFFDYTLLTIYCHEEMDNSDMIGQYEINGGSIFWKNSLLIDKLRQSNKKIFIVFDNPETISKSVFDRLNSLFENERTLNLYEKGSDTHVKIDSLLRIAFLCNDYNGLSSAILDRFWLINLPDNYNIIDASKMKNRTIENIFEQKRLRITKSSFEILNASVFNNELEMFESGIFDTQNTDLKLLPWIFNSYNEEIIENMLDLQIRKIELSNEEKQIHGMNNYKIILEFYKSISFNVEKMYEDESKIQSFSRYDNIYEKTINFMKNSHLSFLEKPINNVYYLKAKILKKLLDSKIIDFEFMKNICKGVVNFNIPENELVLDKFYFEFLEIIKGKNKPLLIFDPITLLKIDCIIIINEKLEEIANNIKSEFKALYKYGKSNFQTVLHEYKTLVEENARKIQEFEMSISQRNWKKYLGSWSNSDQKCQESDMAISKGRMFAEYLSTTTQFSDISDYGLLFNFNPNSFEVCKNSLNYLYFVALNIKECDLIMFSQIIKKYKIPINPEFSRSLFQNSNLFNEMIIQENVVYNIEEEDVAWLEQRFVFQPDFLDKILESMFYQNNEFRIDFLDQPYIRLTDELFKLISENEHLRQQYGDNSIFIKPEKILKDVKDKGIAILYRNSKKILKYDYNFSWYLILYIIDITVEKVTEYLLNTKIYQFLERLYFIQTYLSTKIKEENSAIIYNVSLQYICFELKEKSEKIQNDIKNKIFSDPYEIIKYKGFLSEETITHLIGIKYEENEFYCSCNSNWDTIDYLKFVETDNKARCKYLNIDVEAFKNITFKESHIENIFYNRVVDHKYSSEEITFAKVFNEYVQSVDNLKPENVYKVQTMIKTYIENNICLNFLRFISDFININKQYGKETEDEGIKDGTGQENISEKIMKEDEIERNDAYDDANEVGDDDGVEMSNEGAFDEVGSSDEDSISEVKGCDENKDDDADQDNESFYDNESGDKIEEASDEQHLDEQEDVSDNGTTSTEGEEDIFEKDDSDNLNSNEESIEMEVNDYKMMDVDKVNNEQTCNNAENYDISVKGDGEDAKALEEGENQSCDEHIQGDGSDSENGNFFSKDTKEIDVQSIYNQSEIEFFDLVNSLRYILDGNKPNKFIGNFKTGKRLNMRKIVPFILSGYTLDKIWLKRKRMEKRDYLVRVFVDGSKSMNSEDIIIEIFKIMRKVSGALQVLEIQLELYEFGTKVVKYIDTTDFVRNIKFNQNDTTLDWMKTYNDGINLIITDGIFQIQSEWNDNFAMLIIDKRNIRDLKKILIMNDEVVVQKYLDFLRVRYCLIENVGELDYNFVNVLKEMLKN